MRKMHHSISSFSCTFDLLSVAQSSRTPQSQKYSFPLLLCKVSLGARLSSNSEIGFLEEQASPPSLINCPCTLRTFFKVPVFLHFRRGCSEEEGKTTVPHAHRRHFGVCDGTLVRIRNACTCLSREAYVRCKGNFAGDLVLQSTHTSEEQEDCF